MRPRLRQRLLLAMKRNAPPIRRDRQSPKRRTSASPPAHSTAASFSTRRIIRRQHPPCRSRYAADRSTAHPHAPTCSRSVRRRMPHKIVHRKPSCRHLPCRHRLRPTSATLKTIQLLCNFRVNVPAAVNPIHRLRNDPHIALVLLRSSPCLSSRPSLQAQSPSRSRAAMYFPFGDHCGEPTPFSIADTCIGSPPASESR